MNDKIRTLVTIITESSLEGVLVKEIERLGAQGYTITDARGKGGHGERNATWDADKNIRIEVVCGEATARSIESHFQQKYYDDFAMIIYSSQVSVLRPSKF